MAAGSDKEYDDGDVKVEVDVEEVEKVDRYAVSVVPCCRHTDPPSSVVETKSHKIQNKILRAASVRVASCV
jgi:hypothetical protein